jgi:hypothetical protein
MENSTDVNELLWTEQQRINRARINRDDHQILIRSLLVFASIVLVVAIARYV